MCSSIRNSTSIVLRNEHLKEILASTRAQWDQPEVRSAVKLNFDKVLKSRTEALGFEVYASRTEQKVVHPTCKSRACPSCGHRATILGQREMWTALPDIQYAGVVFTMPAVLWPTLRKNRRLLNDLPAPGTAVTDQWSKDTYGARLMIMVVPHTFGWHLNFNPHLHVLVSAGGLRTSDGVWIQRCHLDKTALMKRWRYALIAYLREAFKRGLLLSAASAQETRRLLTTQYESWWNVDVQPRMTKEHFLQYAGSYARRPPLAQYRIPEHTDEQISFRTKDHKLKREVVTRYTPDEFIGLLADHVPDHYQHAIRHFGILAPPLEKSHLRSAFLPNWDKSADRSCSTSVGLIQFRRRSDWIHCGIQTENECAGRHAAHQPLGSSRPLRLSPNQTATQMWHSSTEYQ